MKRILVIGTGMVAHYLRPYHLHFASRTKKDWNHPHPHHVVDIRDPVSVLRIIEEVNPDVVINAAVFGNIQACERDPAQADLVNQQGQRNVIRVCNDLGVKVVFISTNSVFCGRSGNYSEDHEPHPGTAYGRSKLRGERATQEEADDWAIFRITAIFGDYPGTRDFVQKAIHELSSGNTFPCWDQRITPTYGPFAAQAIFKLVERGVNGVWHVAGKERLRRDEIGEMVRRRVGKGTVVRIPTPPGLPLDRTMSIEKLRKELPGLEIPDFEACLDAVIGKLERPHD